MAYLFIYELAEVRRCEKNGKMIIIDLFYKWGWRKNKLRSKTILLFEAAKIN